MLLRVCLVNVLESDQQRLSTILQKIFTYSMTQNRGSPKTIATTLDAIVPHCFGEHQKILFLV